MNKGQSRKRVIKRPLRAQVVRAKRNASAMATIEDLCQLLGIGRNLAYELVRTKEIPSSRIGRRYLIPRAAIAKLAGGQTNAKPINAANLANRARLGRSIKTVDPGRRHQIGIIIPGETKNMLAERAKKNGRSLSHEFMKLIERALRDEEREKAMGMREWV